MSAQRLQIASEIVHETVDGEVIAIDLGSGSYYSLAGSGPLVWELLGAGATEAEIAVALGTRFEVESETVARDVAALLGELSEHGLIAAADAPAGAGPPPSLAGERAPYEAPRLERYTDMKDYFLLDPIHEVDPAGWPKPAG